MVEAVANGVEDKLVDGLSFKLVPGASYIMTEGHVHSIQSVLTFIHQCRVHV